MENMEAVALSEQNNTMKMLSTRLAVLMDEKDKLDSQVKDLTKQIAEASDTLRRLMESQDMQNFKTPRGTFYINRQTRARVLDSDKAFTFLREAGLGSLIKETVHTSSLSSAVKEMVEQGTIDLSHVQDLGIDVYIDERVKILGRGEK